jgi:hypothetical protein
LTNQNHILKGANMVSWLPMMAVTTVFVLFWYFRRMAPFFKFTVIFGRVEKAENWPIFES